MVARRTACPLDCPDGCSLEVEVVGDRLVKVDAAPADGADNPLTQGFICAKVKCHAERVFGPDRVLTPLVRTGPKGSGQFRTASWAEALDLIVERVTDAAARFGPGSVVPYLYNSSGGMLAKKGLTPLLWQAFGASEVEHTICAATACNAWELVLGDLPGADLLDVVHSRLVVVWGANPSISNTHFPPLVQQARRDNDATLVVVDPRRTGMAKRADLHLAVRPGTDVVLALALGRWLRDHGGVDTAFVEAHAEGVDEYLAACEPWTLGRAADECGVDAADIERLGTLIADEQPAFWRVGFGMERNRNGGSSHRAVLALAVLAGSFGRRGSGVHLHTGHSIGWDADALADAVLGPPGEPGSLGRHHARVLNQNQLGADLTEATLDPPVSVLFVQGANPAIMNPAQAKVQAGLARDDLFTVVHDQVLTDTARFADVVLPATTHFEADDLAKPYGAYTAQATPAVIPRVGESRTNDELAAALAVRLGYPADRFDPSPGRLLGLALAASGGSPAVDPPGRVLFRDVFPDTPGGRAQLIASLDGVAPAPEYRPPGAARPLTLLTPANHHTINSMFGELGAVSADVRMHPDDARERALADGDRVAVVGDAGGAAAVEVVTTLRIDGDLRPGVVMMPKGAWSRASGGGLGANAFAPDALSDLAGGATFNDARVEVTAAE